jgi:hypothetical protein
MAFANHIRTGRVRLFITLGLAVGLSACGGSGGAPEPQLAQSFAVAKANCGAGDMPESGLQGQIPMAERMAGYKGANCNLKKVSSSASSNGEGMFEQFQLVRDKSGRLCGYSGPAFLDSKGTKVVDLSDPNNIVETALITTPGMRNPGEGLRTHEARGLLVSAYYANSPGPALEEAHGFDVYDVGTDCRHPQLLASTTAITISTTGLIPNTPPATSADRLNGHEGAISLDGLTYYVGDSAHNAYHAIDIADPTNPKYLASFQYPKTPAAGALTPTSQTGGTTVFRSPTMATAHTLCLSEVTRSRRAA